MKRDLFFLWDLETQYLYEISNEATFGRSADANFYITDEMSSRLHFKITSKSGKPFIEDLDSRNGTKINGLDLPANEEMDLSPFDLIAVGDNLFIIFDAVSIVNLNREALEKGLPFIAPSSLKEQALKRSVAFFAYVLPEMLSVKSQVDSKAKRDLILAQREKDLSVVNEKNKIIDGKKSELDKMYQEKLSQLNEKYAQVEELRSKVMSKYMDELKTIDDIIDSNITFIKNRKSQHFYDLSQAELTHHSAGTSSTLHELKLKKD